MMCPTYGVGRYFAENEPQLSRLPVGSGECPLHTAEVVRCKNDLYSRWSWVKMLDQARAVEYGVQWVDDTSGMSKNIEPQRSSRPTPLEAASCIGRSMIEEILVRYIFNVS